MSISVVIQSPVMITPEVNNTSGGSVSISVEGATKQTINVSDTTVSIDITNPAPVDTEITGGNNITATVVNLSPGVSIIVTGTEGPQGPQGPQGDPGTGGGVVSTAFLISGTQTAVWDTNVTATSQIFLQATCAEFNPLNPWLAIVNNGQFLLFHDNATGEESFNYLVINP